MNAIPLMVILNHARRSLAGFGLKKQHGNDIAERLEYTAVSQCTFVKPYEGITIY